RGGASTRAGPVRGNASVTGSGVAVPGGVGALTVATVPTVLNVPHDAPVRESQYRERSSLDCDDIAWAPQAMYASFTSQLPYVENVNSIQDPEPQVWYRPASGPREAGPGVQPARLPPVLGPHKRSQPDVGA